MQILDMFKKHTPILLRVSPQSQSPEPVSYRQEFETLLSSQGAGTSEDLEKRICLAFSFPHQMTPPSNGMDKLGEQYTQFIQELQERLKNTSFVTVGSYAAGRFELFEDEISPRQSPELERFGIPPKPSRVEALKNNPQRLRAIFDLLIARMVADAQHNPEYPREASFYVKQLGGRDVGTVRHYIQKHKDLQKGFNVLALKFLDEANPHLHAKPKHFAKNNDRAANQAANIVADKLGLLLNRGVKIIKTQTPVAQFTEGDKQLRDILVRLNQATQKPQVEQGVTALYAMAIEELIIQTEAYGVRSDVPNNRSMQQANPRFSSGYRQNTFTDKTGQPLMSSPTGTHVKVHVGQDAPTNQEVIDALTRYNTQKLNEVAFHYNGDAGGC